MAGIGIKVMQRDKTVFLQILPLFYTSFLLSFTKKKKVIRMLCFPKISTDDHDKSSLIWTLKSFPYSLSPDLSLIKLFVLFDGNIKLKCLEHVAFYQ